jgi:hypothetical protein
MGWEQCVALQPADMFAYEAFKETEREMRRPGCKPRISLIRSFGEGSQFGGNAGTLGKNALRELKSAFYALDDTVKAIVLATARVSTRKPKTTPKKKRH